MYTTKYLHSRLHYNLDGAQSALDAWEKPGTGASRRKNQRKKKAKTRVSFCLLAVTTVKYQRSQHSACTSLLASSCLDGPSSQTMRIPAHVAGWAIWLSSYSEAKSVECARHHNVDPRKVAVRWLRSQEQWLWRARGSNLKLFWTSLEWPTAQQPLLPPGIFFTVYNFMSARHLCIKPSL